MVEEGGEGVHEGGEEVLGGHVDLVARCGVRLVGGLGGQGGDVQPHLPRRAPQRDVVVGAVRDGLCGGRAGGGGRVIRSESACAEEAAE